MAFVTHAFIDCSHSLLGISPNGQFAWRVENISKGDLFTICGQHLWQIANQKLPALTGIQIVSRLKGGKDTQ
jgi:hypothetical protein